MNSFSFVIATEILLLLSVFSVILVSRRNGYSETRSHVDDDLQKIKDQVNGDS